MSHSIVAIDGGLEWRDAGQRLRIEPWGRDSLRVRATPHSAFPTPCAPEGLVDPAAVADTVRIDADSGELVNGAITARLSADGHLRFLRSSDGEELLAEIPVRLLYPAARRFSAREGDLFHTEARFTSYPGERFYGLGQHKHGLLDQRGCVLELQQANSEVNIPVLFSSRGYAFLWHNPGIGRVELAENQTRWVADASRGIDYWISAGDTWAALSHNYADATGHAPRLPHWATGFIQCKLRYKTQDELLAVAREYRRRGLPLDCIVIDFFHWHRMGDFDFDPEAWPDPDAMIAELREMGVELMISVWPTFNPNSRYFDEMQRRGFMIGTRGGAVAAFEFLDMDVDGRVYLQHYDPTNPAARAFVWDKIKAGYVDRGIRTLWLDCCEPQLSDVRPHDLRLHAGDGAEVANIYPLAHQHGVYHGLRETGEEEIFTLCRSAFAGSQRYGAAVWSGDIHSTFPVLAGQVRAGLNMCMSGIPWWTTDIGGFMFGDPTDPGFRELIVRWFQYGVFCPLFRLHGVREPVIDHKQGGQPNEIWSFGDEAYPIIRDLLFLRERLRPYVTAVMAAASDEGLPPMRPLFFDYEDDPATHAIDDQFLFGPDLLVCPVTAPGVTSRPVYLPRGADWIDTRTGETCAGGEHRTADAPLASIPVYLRAGGAVDLATFRGDG